MHLKYLSIGSEFKIAFVNKKKAELNEKNIILKKNAKKIYDIINIF